MTKKLSDAVLQHLGIMQTFEKATYEKAFLNYKKQYYPVIEAISKDWESCEETEKDAYLDKVVKEFLEEIGKSIEVAGNSKAASRDKTNACRLVQALYTIPMIRDTKLPVAEVLAEKLVEGWKQAYPKYIYKMGDFETLKSGFDKKQFCYITTAVCETLGRPDDCYELTMFRQFRDGYLRKQPDGEQLVQEYYRRAPEIVKKIDESADSISIYRGIWEEHLKPCLSLIENGEDAACKERYMQMVNRLEEQFM